MIIGVPKEIKNNENRVSATPTGIADFVKHGHTVWVEKTAGEGSGFADEEYVAAGAILKDTAEETWAADMVLKVKEPVASEYKYFREGLVLFTYLHLAAEPELTKALVEKKVTSIAYETVELPNHSLPLLTPMSEVAGRMSVQVGARLLEKFPGGRGVLLGSVPGVRKSKVTIIGGGISGINAAKMALGLGARVTIMDVNANRLKELDDIFNGQVDTLMSSVGNIAHELKDSDLVIGAVLLPGAKAPKLVTDEMVRSMPKGSVIVDIAIDQGGIFETHERITTHDDPSYVKHGVVHYSVANMPGAVPRTSTFALSNVTLPYAVKLANMGYKDALLSDEGFLKGLNTHDGVVTYKAVADTFNMEFKDPSELF
ncbi:MAG: alanine dehydrogenase [Streptococcaceae bacterium]|jgi:alanine dehydrogenase|nr:alanine dehydrogenase [Streptococcaceae bacterium]